MFKVDLIFIVVQLLSKELRIFSIVNCRGDEIGVFLPEKRQISK